jgi:hypothetical protein
VDHRKVLQRRDIETVVLDDAVDEIDLDNNLLDRDEEVQTLKLKRRIFL